MIVQSFVFLRFKVFEHESSWKLGRYYCIDITVHLWTKEKYAFNYVTVTTLPAIAKHSELLSILIPLDITVTIKKLVFRYFYPKSNIMTKQVGKVLCYRYNIYNS